MEPLENEIMNAFILAKEAWRLNREDPEVLAKYEEWGKIRGLIGSEDPVATAEGRERAASLLGVEGLGVKPPLTPGSGARIVPPPVSTGVVGAASAPPPPMRKASRPRPTKRKK